MELTMSAFAWMGVLLLQAVVHYSLGARRRQRERQQQCQQQRVVEVNEEALLLVDEHPVIVDDITININEVEEENCMIVNDSNHMVTDRLCYSSSLGEQVSDDDDENSLPDHEINTVVAAVSTASVCACPGHIVLEDDQSSTVLDGDEPQMFFRLLSQTGCEMVRSSRSLECIVQEQIKFGYMDELPIRKRSYLYDTSCVRRY